MRFRKDRERELNAELSFHCEQQLQEYLAAGMHPAEARRRVRIEFGGTEQIKEECRDVRPFRWLETASKDLRYAFRTLRASPLFTLTAVLSLALGIGANTAIFTLLHAALWKPLPVRDPHQIFHLLRASTNELDTDYSTSYVLYQQLSQAGASFGELFATGSFGLRKFGLDSDSAERVTGQAVSANFFSVLRIEPALGRLFEAKDDSILGGNRVAVLSHAFWTRRFQASPTILGKTIFYKETDFTVVGVAQPGFAGIEAEAPMDLWVPVTADAPKDWLNNPHTSWLNILGRLRPGASAARAEAVFQNVFRSHVQRELFPGESSHFKAILEAQHLSLRQASSGLSTTGRKYRKPLFLLMGVVALVLLISCANVANLVLARNAARQHEITVRLALGAGRARIAGQLFTESLLLALLGAAGGVMLAAWSSRVLIAMLPQSRVQLAFDVRPDLAVLGFTAAIAAVTAILFGLAPALRACRGGLAFQSGPRMTGGSRIGKILVAGQLALSLLLLIGAGLFLGTIRNLKTADLGFRAENVVTFDVSFRRGTSTERIRAAYKQLQERLESYPGVIAASHAWPSVYDRGGWSNGVEAEGHPAVPGEDNEACMISVGPDFFETIGLRLLQGRYLNARDAAGAPPVAVVNESLARHYFDGGSAIGRRLKFGGNPPVLREIVGVVSNAKHFGVREKVCRMVYVPSSANGSFFVRANVDPRQLSRIIRELAPTVDGAPQVEQIRPFQTVVDNMVNREQIIAVLSSVFGALAALLAAIGLYGVMAYAISRRTSEVGIRMALGAQRRDVQWMVLQETIRLVGLGISIGVAVAMGITPLLSGMLYGVNATDIPVFAGAVALLIGVAGIAGYVPAWRASRIDPMVALRHE